MRKISKENLFLHLPPPPWVRLMAFVSLFASGCILGGIGGSIWTRTRIFSMIQNPEQTPDRILARIRAGFSLNSEQERRVEAIVRQRYTTMETIRGKAYSAQISEFYAMREEVSAVLSAEERAKWLLLCSQIETRYLPRRR